MITVDMLGYLAGAINLASAAPQILKAHRDPGGVAEQSALRNLMIVLANALWSAYGFAAASIPIATMCGIGCLLNAVVLAQIVQARHFQSTADA